MQRARLKFEIAEAESVGDDRDRAEAHGGAGEHRAEQPAENGIEYAGGDGDAESVVKKSEEQILFDVADGGAAKFSGAQDAAQIAFEQSDAGGFDGDVGAGTHGDADMGGGESRSVIDAVAGHGDDAPFLLQFGNNLRFLRGRNFGVDVFDLKLFRDGCGRRFPVAGQHHEFDAFGS